MGEARTDAKIIEMWLFGKPRTTVEAYYGDISQFFEFLNKPMADIRLEDMQAFSKELERRGLKDSSRARKINALKSLFSFAVAQQHLPLNPAAAIKSPKASRNYAGRILSREDVLKIIAAARPGRDRVFLLVCYSMGLRISEACNLRWSDFVTRSDGKVQVNVLGKGDKEAVVMVPAEVWDEMEALLEYPGDELFPFQRRAAHEIVKRAVKAAGLPDTISMHWLRHSLARHSLEAGAPIHLVRDTLRHSSIAITDAYLQSFPDQSASDYLDFNVPKKNR
jgi:integrase/recombinase XerD